MLEYLIGVDGGGSGTRVRLARADGSPLAQGRGGPSALAHGIQSAWSAVNGAVAQAFAEAGLAVAAPGVMAIGLGLAGVHNQQWAASFVAHNPGYAAVALESDALTTLLGAHQGRPGAIIALGTGSVGEALDAQGRRRAVGGWGFPAGDEAGGAWIGMRAIGHVQHALDGRAAMSAFAAAIIGACGATPAAAGRQDRDQLQNQQDLPALPDPQDLPARRDVVQRWLAGANQTVYAQLARLVVAHGASDPAAHAILCEAGSQVALIAAALDAGGQLPLALCGGLAAPLTPYLPVSLLRRLVAAHGDSAMGALGLIQRRLREPAPSITPAERQPC